jgi:hypothetical protein
MLCRHTYIGAYIQVFSTHLVAAYGTHNLNDKAVEITPAHIRMGLSTCNSGIIPHYQHTPCTHTGVRVSVSALLSFATRVYVCICSESPSVDRRIDVQSKENSMNSNVFATQMLCVCLVYVSVRVCGYACMYTSACPCKRVCIYSDLACGLW